ncbi:MAG: hypothetical protein Q7U48_13695 [Hydrogenophaga sp.]|nr:hypothetical protein [Hydrogenophaga sp.]
MPASIFYDPRMNVTGLSSLSPSASKPAALMALLKERNRYDVVHGVYPVAPVTIGQLKLVHDTDYVDGVFAGRILNGFECIDSRVPEACLWTVGSLVGAVRHAAEHPVHPTLSPSSGFHHAHFGEGGGFCTFNGLAVAAALYLQDHPDHRVGILDCDVHYGDGTADILRRLPFLADRVVHHTSGRYFHEDAERLEFFAWLQQSIAAINEADCDVVIYQAGADMHKDDPLGGFLDDDDMALRDRMVFRGIRAGIAWNLAGGYRTLAGDCTPVLNTHHRTYGEANASVAQREQLRSST